MNGKNSNKKRKYSRPKIDYHFPLFSPFSASLTPQNPHLHKTLWRRYQSEGGFGSDGITETFLIPSHIRLSPFLILIFVYKRWQKVIYYIAQNYFDYDCVYVCVLKRALFANGKLYLISNPSNVNVNFPSPSRRRLHPLMPHLLLLHRLSIVSSHFHRRSPPPTPNFHPQIFLISLFDALFAYNRDIDNAHLTAWWYARDNDKKRLQYPSLIHWHRNPYMCARECMCYTPFAFVFVNFINVLNENVIRRVMRAGGRAFWVYVPNKIVQWRNLLLIMYFPFYSFILPLITYIHPISCYPPNW